MCNTLQNNAGNRKQDGHWAAVKEKTAQEDLYTTLNQVLSLPHLTLPWPHLHSTNFIVRILDIAERHLETSTALENPEI